MDIQRRPIPGSYIVLAPRERAVELPGARVLGQCDDRTALLVNSDRQPLAPGLEVMPNYEYQGDLRDEPSPGGSDTADHLKLIEAPRAWQVTRGRPEATAAITDSGVDTEHPLMRDTFWHNPGEVAGNGVDDDGNGKVDDLLGYDFSDNDGNPHDTSDVHHTHVHGIALGVAPEARAMALRVAGGKRPFSSAMLMESYLYAMNEGVKTVNTSFNIDAFVGDKAVEGTYRILADHDVLLFNSAGNDGKHNPKRSRFEDVVLVAATDAHDKRAEFSNYGVGIDISAPGEDIVSTLPGGRTGKLSGTSMASPVAMGVDLLVRSAHPDWNRAQRWAQIAGTADPIEAEMGFGRVNAGRALSETVGPPSLTVTPETFPNGQTMKLTVRFDKVFDPAGANDREAFQVLNEKGEAVMQGPPHEVRLMTNEIEFNVARLPIGHYQFVASAAHLHDPFGQPLQSDVVVPFDRVA